MLNELKTLCTLPGPSGWEDAVRDYIATQAAPHAHSMRVDAMGNLIVEKKGTLSAPGKLMLCAHVDEVGLIIRSITEDGYLKFAFLGGVDRRVVIGKRVLVGEKAIPGVIGIKAYHLVSREEETSVPKAESLYIDIGAKDKESAEKLVDLGDYAVFDSDCIEFGDGMFKGRAIDDRLGCAVMLALLRQELPMDVTFAFTVQEEIGTRGAFGAAFSVTPEIALVLETTTAADLPSSAEHQRVCIPGDGPVISYMDGGTIYDRGLFELLRDTAERNEIPWQMKHYIAGGTDARAVQRTKTGVRVAGLAAAVRYLHAPAGVGSIRDFDHILRLSRLFIDAIAQSVKEGK
ncbi:MAG: M42 family metallopeptidase [Ruminococcaceae bacterium]|nr:M42 family metallopeptidase [Oscillospiraceae bacterium]